MRRRRKEKRLFEDEGFLDLLERIRWRLWLIIFFVLIGMSVAWYYYDPLFSLILGPVKGMLRKGKDVLAFQGPLEPLMTRIWICVAAGLVASMPVIAWAFWGMVSPLLGEKGRLWGLVVVPSSLLLFWAGILATYKVLPLIFYVLGRFMPSGPLTFLYLSPLITARFIAKIYLAAGAVFQMPLIFGILGRLGVVDANFLLSKWRLAVIVILVVMAILTPTWDAFTMLAASLPLILLYFGSILVVRLVQRRPREEEEWLLEEEEEEGALVKG